MESGRAIRVDEDAPEGVEGGSSGADAVGDTGGEARRWPWLVGLAAGLLALFAVSEARTSRLQARFISDWSADISYALEPGPAADPIRSARGPYDLRLGYARIPEWVPALEARGFEIKAQAGGSPRALRAAALGLFPIYPEKAQAGLTVTDRAGRVYYGARHPERVYPTFESIPAPIVRALLFIENRELLDPGTPYRNPAVEWDRLAGSLLKFTARQFGAAGSIAGASTLATQIEKFRHSPDGLTRSPGDKLRQMATAMARAYAGGPETEAARRRIVLDYVNSVPFAGILGYGEVIGLQDGLWAWFGLDPTEVNARLAPCTEALEDAEGLQRYESGDAATGAACADDEDGAARGEAFRAAVSLMLAQRRPSFYLVRPDGHEALRRLGDVYLDLMSEAQTVPAQLITAAREAWRDPLPRSPERPQASFLERKSANATRTRLLELLDMDRLYELDRLDLSVHTTFDQAAQDSATRTLRRLADPSYVRSIGFDQFRLLGTGDPRKVLYSFVLYERTPRGNVVRVQTDNFDGPFDLNESSRLELGSTAKLRTLVLYLEVIERLHDELIELPAERRRAVADSLPDPLTRWVIDYLRRYPEADLRTTLDAAMERTYSASPGERFFTGGGTHVFNNFDGTHDGSVLSVRVGFRHSVNLVFVRLMRDIERFYRWRIPEASARILEDPEDPARAVYLDRFVEREGRQFVSRFYNTYRGKNREEILLTLASGRRMSPQRLAWTFRSVLPSASLEEFEVFLRLQSPNSDFTPRAIQDAFARAQVERFSWADQGYLASIHPLELWVARHLIESPDADRASTQLASAGARRDVYRWLFSARRRRAQDRSISVILELEAFLEIQRAWQRLGYPFENVVPSYGTAIGSSGDRPGALAELAGIILSGGIRQPSFQIDALRFGGGTPFEVSFEHRVDAGERVLSRQVSAVAREALLDVVSNGTARSVASAVRNPAGEVLAIGGKTGTGDNQFRVFGTGGRLLETRTLNRTATFVFIVGDRHYGVVTAHVQGSDARVYRFTSALPVRVLGLLAPHLAHLFEEEGAALALTAAALPDEAPTVR